MDFLGDKPTKVAHAFAREAMLLLANHVFFKELASPVVYFNIPECIDIEPFVINKML